MQTQAVPASRNTVQPWYKQGWPWFLMAFPATAVVAGLITFWIAYDTFDGMVVDDYYKEGRAIGQTVARSAKAAELGLTAQVTLRAGEFSMVLASSQGAQLPSNVFVTIAHPTREGYDQTLVLVGRNGVFSASVQPLTAGRWLLQIEDESRAWRLNGTANLPAETEIRIVPYDS